MWAASGYLAPLDAELEKTDWWSEFPDLVKGFGALDGKTYSVSQGENTAGIYYNIPMFQKAGIQTPWQPKSWDDILTAARKIKAAVPDTSPVWLQGGTEAGFSGTVYGFHNLLLGTSTPSVYNEETQKWIVESAGIRDSLQFYSTLAKEGLQAKPADLLNTNAIINAPQVIADQSVAIAVGSNWYGPCWVTYECPKWTEAANVLGVAKIPTKNGGDNPYASSATGWALGISATDPNQRLAWEFVNMLNEPKWAVMAAKGAELVPANRKYQSDPEYINDSPPVQCGVRPHPRLLRCIPQPA